MVKAFSGKKYKLDSSTNFDAYMQAMGVNEIARKMGNSFTPVMELVVNGDEYTLNVTSNAKSQTATFKLGQEVEYEAVDGKKVKSTFTVDGNMLVEAMKGAKETTIVREFSDKEVIITMTCGDVVATRVYRVV